jgi:hypothetical protein
MLHVRFDVTASAPPTISLRPKRRGIACQQLRANAALVIEWIQILWREGWLGSARRNRADGLDMKALTDKADDAVANFRRWRVKVKLHQPYGKAAIKRDSTARFRPLREPSAEEPKPAPPPAAE